VSIPPADVGLSQVEQIAVVVHDVDRAVLFYRDVLGLPFLFQVQQMAFFQCGGVRLMLGIPSEPEFDHPSSIIYYRVADIQAAHQTLVARGVSFRGEPHVVHRAPDHEQWMAFFYDVDRNTLALACRKALG
jgi:catechol 2,3-dioxygenase-like lactoylglutathione lyase family enzyme